MNLDTEIKVEKDFISGLSEAFSLLSKINSSPDRSDTISFEPHSFTTPLFEAILLAKANEVGREKNILIKTDSTTYQDLIYFDKGGLDTQCINDLDQFLEEYRDKTYFPILKIHASDQDSKKRFTSIGSLVYGYLERQLSLQSGSRTAVNYLISESMDNIIEHSQSPHGYIACQVYPKRKYMDLCIIDTGITIPGSYRQTGIVEDTCTDAEALRLTLTERISTKNSAGSVNRGFGIYTSRRMLVEGLRGEYVLLSGTGLLVSTPKGDRIISLPPHLGIKGTIVGMRVPEAPQDFVATQYYE